MPSAKTPGSICDSIFFPRSKASDSKGYLTGWYMPKDDDLPTILDPDDTERYRIRLNHYWNATDRDQVLLQALFVSDIRVQKDFFRKVFG